MWAIYGLLSDHKKAIPAGTTPTQGAAAAGDFKD